MKDSSPVDRDHPDDGQAPDLVALPRLMPLTGPVATELRAELLAREQRRFDDFHQALAADIDLEVLAQRILEHERFGDMLHDAVDAALRTHDTIKIQLLAKAVGSGVLAEDEKTIDEAQQLLRLVTELDPADVRALSALRDRSRGYGHPIACIRHELDVSSALASLIHSRLERLGLVEVESNATFDKSAGDGGDVELYETWSLSDGAKALLEMLDEVS